MLCIALFTSVLIEDATAYADPCHATGAVSYNVAAEAIDGAAGSLPDEGPAGALHAHHCCGAHATGLPIAAPAPSLPRVTAANVTPLGDAFVASDGPGGPERPPRTTDIV